MSSQDDSHKVILTSFEDEYEESHNPVWVWHAIDFCSTWQRKTGNPLPYPQWVVDYLSVTASLLLKLDDREHRAGDDILQVIGIRDHSITASILTIRDKVVFLEIQSLINKGMESGAALSIVANTFSLSSEAVEDIFQKFSR